MPDKKANNIVLQVVPGSVYGNVRQFTLLSRLRYWIASEM